jgi:uncharacterized protein (TIGR02594 family)
MAKNTFANLAAEYKSLWDNAVIRPEHLSAVKATAQKVRELKPTYDHVSAITKVPWYIVGVIHNLESSFSMDDHLHNGDPLTGRTVQEPSGRPKSGLPRFTWEESAIDALTMHGMQNVGAAGWSIERIGFELERYNGFGYRNRHPGVKSPYLWSFTNQYSTGKYVRDGKFDSTKASDQVGAMAVLKQLIAEGAVTIGLQANVPPKPTVPPVPVPTGLFVPSDDQAFQLRAAAQQDADKIQHVETNQPVRKLAEVNADWWNVEVMVPDGTTMVGFARKVWLTPQTVMSSFDLDEFAQVCVDVAGRYGTTANLLIALADAETALTNKASPDGLYFGPFAISESEWKAANDPADTGVGAEGRFKPIAQAAVAARFIVQLTQQARENLPDKRLPGAEELCLARIFGANLLPAMLNDTNQAKAVRDVLAPMPAADIDAIFARRPGLLTTGITVGALRKAIEVRLATAFDDAAGLVGKADPEISIGPPETTDPGEVPWMVIAKQQLDLDIHEFPNGSNPEIEKYFTATTLGRQPDDIAWCAAFISWCIQQSGTPHPGVTFSARAGDWMNNGRALDGPQFGAIVVTVPLARGASGHVGFAHSWDGTSVHILGGNQGDAVKIAKFPIKVVKSWRMV